MGNYLQGGWSERPRKGGNPGICIVKIRGEFILIIELE